MKLILLALFLIVYCENVNLLVNTKNYFIQQGIEHESPTKSSFKTFLKARGSSEIKFLQQGENGDAVAPFKNYLPKNQNSFNDINDKDVQDYIATIKETTNFIQATFWHSTDLNTDTKIKENGFKPTIPDDYIYDGAICGRLYGVFFALYVKPSNVHYPREKSISAPTFIITDPVAAFTKDISALNWYFISFSTGQIQNFNQYTTQILILMTEKSSKELRESGVENFSPLNKDTNPFIRLKNNKLMRVPEKVDGYDPKINLNVFIDMNDKDTYLEFKNDDVYTVKSINTYKKKSEDDKKRREEKKKEEEKKEEKKKISKKRKNESDDESDDESEKKKKKVPKVQKSIEKKQKKIQNKNIKNKCKNMGNGNKRLLKNEVCVVCLKNALLGATLNGKKEISKKLQRDIRRVMTNTKKYGPNAQKEISKMMNHLKKKGIKTDFVKKVINKSSKRGIRKSNQKRKIPSKKLNRNNQKKNAKRSQKNNKSKRSRNKKRTNKKRALSKSKRSKSIKRGKRPTKRSAKKPKRHTKIKRPSTKRSSKRSSKRATKRSSKRPTKRSLKKPSKRSSKRPTKRPVNRSSKRITKKPTKRSSKRPSKKPAKRSTKKPSQRSQKRPTKRSSKRPTKRPLKRSQQLNQTKKPQLVKRPNQRSSNRNTLEIENESPQNGNIQQADSQLISKLKNKFGSGQEFIKSFGEYLGGNKGIQFARVMERRMEGINSVAPILSTEEQLLFDEKIKQVIGNEVYSSLEYISQEEEKKIIGKYDDEIKKEKLILNEANATYQNVKQASEKQKKRVHQQKYQQLHREYQQNQRFYQMDHSRKQRCCSRGLDQCCYQRIYHPSGQSYGNVFRRLERRTRSLLRRIERTNNSRRLHQRTRNLIRRMESLYIE